MNPLEELRNHKKVLEELILDELNKLTALRDDESFNEEALTSLKSPVYTLLTLLENLEKVNFGIRIQEYRQER